MVFAQQSLPDSLRNIMDSATSDSLRYKASWVITSGYYYGTINRDTALYITEQALLLARRNNKKLPEARALIYKGQLLSIGGRYAESLKCLLEAITIAEDPESEKNTWIFDDDNFPPHKSRLSTLSYAHNVFAILMFAVQNTEQQIIHSKESRKIAEGINDSTRIVNADISLGRIYIDINMLDSALFFMKDAEKIALQYDQRKSLSIILYRLGDIYLQLGDKALARQFFYQSSSKLKNRITRLLWSEIICD